MSASTGNLLTLLEGNDPVGVVFYRDDLGRESLLELCGLLAPRDRRVLETDDVLDAFLPEYKDAVLLVVTRDELEAVRALEGQRDKLLDRESPAILLLMQGGRAEKALNLEAPALSSFLRGLTYDPEPPANEREIDERRADFSKRHLRTPSEWLGAWQRGEIEDTVDSNLTAQEAWALLRA